MISSSNPQDVTLIACVARDGGIGFQNRLLWHHSEDMQRFRLHTVGHTVVMGRCTWESLPPSFKPLPQRDNMVLSRNPVYSAPGARVVASISEALNLVRSGSEFFVIGGGQLYTEMLPMATKLVLTEVDAVFAADAFFPAWNRSEFEVAEREPHRDANGVAFDFVTYRRVITPSRFLG